ncbi:hypothetical protein ASE26_02660 [Duganella sp. Root198D2]|nr:hypothetical protein ASD07_15360 [Duganella sp. Root336D2]KRC03748.1 hypothetical protein ASE26_02660 [Duganella sp. Root198D2]
MEQRELGCEMSQVFEQARTGAGSRRTRAPDSRLALHWSSRANAMARPADRAAGAAPDEAACRRPTLEPVSHLGCDPMV